MMKKYIRGVRKYICNGRTVYDIIVIKWDEENQWYTIRTADCVLENNDDFKDDICGQWAYTIPTAKRKALIDTGLKSKDFVWEEIEKFAITIN